MGPTVDGFDHLTYSPVPPAAECTLNQKRDPERVQMNLVQQPTGKRAKTQGDEDGCKHSSNACRQNCWSRSPGRQAIEIDPRRHVGAQQGKRFAKRQPGSQLRDGFLAGKYFIAVGRC